ncbi:14515_t:CDS:2, partial [Gigaspora rosea]
ATLRDYRVSKLSFINQYRMFIMNIRYQKNRTHQRTFQNAEVMVFGSVNTELYLLICASKPTVVTSAKLHPEIQTGRVIPDDENLGILLIELFELYGIVFNYKQLAIRVERDNNLGVDIGYYKK